MLSINIPKTNGNESLFPFVFGTVVKDLNVSGGEINSLKFGSYFTSYSTGIIFDNVHIYNL